MGFGPYESVNIFDLVDDIKDELGVGGNSNYDGIVFKLVSETGIHLDSIQQWKKCTVQKQVQNGRFCIPKGMVRLLSIRPYRSEEQIKIEQDAFVSGQLISPFPNWVFVYSTDYKPEVGPMENIGMLTSLGEIVGDQFVFNTSFSFEKVDVTYDGYDMDGCTVRIIPEQMRAIRAYVKYQMSTMKKYKALFERGDTRIHASEWAAQKSWLQGEAFMREADDSRMQLKTMYTAMFVNQNSVR